MTTMKDFIPHEQSLELKKIGFDEPCFGWYSNMDGNVFRQGYCETYLGIENCAKAPLYQQAFKWFRENCDWPIETWIQPYLSINPRTYEGLYWRRGETESVGIYDTYEEAELACLIKLIEIVKTKQP
jgi:hypothetical protein